MAWYRYLGSPPLRYEPCIPTACLILERKEYCLQTLAFPFSILETLALNEAFGGLEDRNGIRSDLRV